MPNSAGGKELQHFYFYFLFVEWPGVQARHVKRCNALVCSVILYRTQQEVKNYNNFNFNSLNGPGQEPGMLSDVMHLSAQRFCAELSRS